MTDLVITNLRSERIARTHYLQTDSDLVLSSTEITGLTGPSGSGKTLLFRAIADLDQAGGQFRLDATDRESMAAHEWRKRVCFLPAESAWWYETVGEHFPVGSSTEYLEALGFAGEVMGWTVSDLSSGERQRLALLRCLSNLPDVLLLDEPTAALDKNRTLDVEQLVLGYAKKTNAAVFWISHDIEQLNRVASQVYTISNDGMIRVMQK